MILIALLFYWLQSEPVCYIECTLVWHHDTFDLFCVNKKQGVLERLCFSNILQTICVKRPFVSVAPTPLPTIYNHLM